MLTEIVRNVSVLLALALLFDVMSSRIPLRAHPLRALAAGLAVGLLAVGVMTAPLQLTSGLIFDTRSVILALSGFFFGTAATIVAVLLSASYRLYLGGSGTLLGLAVIVASGAIGIGWRVWRSGPLEQVRVGELYALGLTVHAAMIVLMAVVPSGLSPAAFWTVSLWVLVIFPIATTALGLFMLGRIKRDRVGERVEGSERRYRALFDNNHAVMLVIDPVDGRIVDANPAASRFYGWSREELTTRSIAEINTLPEEEVREEMRRARAGQRTFFRVRHRVASGQIRDVEVMSGEVTIKGRPLLYSIVVHDVTNERIAEEALLLVSAALDNAVNAIMITDREGTIEWVNAAFNQLYGYSAEEALGKNPRDLLKSGVQGPEFYQAMWRTLLAGETWRGNITNLRKDGSHVEEDLAITPIRSESGEIGHYVAVKHDLTEWRALERRLALSQKLESIGQLAGGVAHDFNNLLTVINGTLDLVLRELPAEDSIRSDLREVREAGERAGILTRQLLAFSKMQVLRREAVNLNALILDMSSMFRRLIGEDIDIYTDLDEQPPFALADRSQLEQVLVNLVVNARDAMPNGGTLRIATAGPRRSENPSSVVDPGGHGFVRLSVSDNGEGMEPDVQSRIFDPFFTTKGPGRGTGLGLATIYGIVSQSGGEIHVISAPGQGSTFEILLPATSETAAPSSAEERSHTGGGSETILVVEDEAAIRNLVVRILSREGYTVLAARDGRQALELMALQGDSVALLFTDVVMPSMSGPELLGRARELKPELKVLYASGYTADTLHKHGVREESFHFLEKPYTPKGLAVAVRGVLDEQE